MISNVMCNTLAPALAEIYFQHDSRTGKYNLHYNDCTRRHFTGGFLLLRIFSVAISVNPHVCFILKLNFDFYVSKRMHL